MKLTRRSVLASLLAAIGVKKAAAAPSIMPILVLSRADPQVEEKFRAMQVGQLWYLLGHGQGHGQLCRVYARCERGPLSRAILTAGKL